MVENVVTHNEFLLKVDGENLQLYPWFLYVCATLQVCNNNLLF